MLKKIIVNSLNENEYKIFGNIIEKKTNLNEIVANQVIK